MGLVKGITADYCCQGVGAARLHAIKRISQPEEIANAALLLAMSSFVMGSPLYANGGNSAVK